LRDAFGFIAHRGLPGDAAVGDINRGYGGVILVRDEQRGAIGREEELFGIIACRQACHQRAGLAVADLDGVVEAGSNVEVLPVLAQQDRTRALADGKGVHHLACADINHADARSAFIAHIGDLRGSGRGEGAENKAGGEQVGVQCHDPILPHRALASRLNQSRIGARPVSRIFLAVRNRRGGSRVRRGTVTP
jgi:hypothetical protein